jgi:hypothetical protein
MKITCSTEEPIGLLTFEKTFLEIRNHYLKIKNITHDSKNITLILKNRHRIITIELEEDNYLFKGFIRDMTINIKNHDLKKLTGHLVKLEIEKKGNAIEIKSLTPTINLNLENQQNEYFKLVNFSVRNFNLFLQGLSENIGIEKNILNLLIPFSSSQHDNSQFLSSIELLNGLLSPSYLDILQNFGSKNNQVNNDISTNDQNSEIHDDPLLDQAEYYEKNSLYVYDPDIEIVSIREKTMDDIIEDFQRDEEKQILEDFNDKENFESEESNESDNPLLDNDIWNEIYGKVYSDSFLYDVIINYEFSHGLTA